MRKAESGFPKRGAKTAENVVSDVIVDSWNDRAKLLAAKKHRVVRYSGVRRSSGIHEGMTFKELQDFLTRHGFEPVETAGTHKAYKETAGQAVIMLPPYKDSDEIRPFHLASVRKLLTERGVIRAPKPE